MKPEAEQLKLWRERPDIFVRQRYGVTPDAWQEEALRAFPSSPRIAMKSAAGTGKTAELAWLGLNFLLTRPHSRVGATSISGANLKAGLWAELATWYQRDPVMQREFEFTSSEIYHRQHRATWKIEARTWPQDANPNQIGNALRGLHGEYVMWLLDESGAYPESILPVCENIFSGTPREAHIVQAGNPTSTTGPLYRACVRARHLWKVIEITGDPDNPNRSSRVGLEYAKAQIEQYGRDNPWVMVNILGQFPPSSLNSLLGVADIEAAYARRYQQHDIDHAAKVLGVDVAREGDDSSVIFPRRGLVAFKPVKMRGATGNQGAAQVNRMWEDTSPDAVFIDNSGGWGASWIDALATMNRVAIPVSFAGAPADKRYYNKRAEMYFRLAEWVKGGGALPADCPELMSDLTEPTYSFQGDRMLIEPKEMLKKRIGRSPDDGDALALTFAEPIARRLQSPLPQRQDDGTHYDPFAELRLT